MSTGGETKRRIREAFVALLAQKPLRSITVRELAAKAGISRGAFYFHYEDVYQLRASMEEELLLALRQVTDSVSLHLAEARSAQTPPALTALFAYVENHSALCRALFGKNGDPSFLRRVKQEVLARALDRFIPGGKQTPRQHCLMEYGVSGTLGVLEDWLESDAPGPAQELADAAWEATCALAARGGSRKNDP